MRSLAHWQGKEWLRDSPWEFRLVDKGEVRRKFGIKAKDNFMGQRTMGGKYMRKQGRKRD